MKFRYFLLMATVVFSARSNIAAQELTTSQVDSIALKAMNTFNVPGLSLAIVKDGRVFYVKGYGVRSIDTHQPMDIHTLVGIASNTKAFTTAAIGILVDEGKIKWDDPVKKYIPEFNMYDDYVTSNFTIRDLLTHRSGLAPGAGDLLHNPDSTDYTVDDVIRALHYLKPVAAFRSKYTYDNILYIVAGELVSRLSGMSLADFFERRIMQPLAMNDSHSTFERINGNPNVIDGHHEENGQLVAGRPGAGMLDLGAGGIFSSAHDMAKWMLMQLEGRLLSAETHKEMWTPQTLIPVTRPGGYNTHFAAYGLGWFLKDTKGFLQVSHTGQDFGMISEVLLIPELHYGITVLTNRDGGAAVLATADQITDGFLGLTGTDRINEWNNRIKSQDHASDTALAIALKQTEGKKMNSAALLQFTGIYRDNWFGVVRISPHKDCLWFEAERSHELKGEMVPYIKNTWLVRWQNRSLNADAFVTFEEDKSGKITGMLIKPVSPSTSASFDFGDLSFRKIK